MTTVPAKASATLPGQEQDLLEVLQHRLEQQTHEVVRRQRVLDGLRDLLALLNSHRPLTEMLEYIVEKAGELMGTDSAAIFTLVNEDTVLTIQSACGLPDSYVGGRKVPLEHGLVGTVFTGKQVAEIRNTVTDFLGDTTLHPGSEQQSLVEWLVAQYKSLLAVPLVVKGKVYGVLVLYYPTAREFAQEERDLAASFADFAALAIENTRLLEQSEAAAATAERTRLARDLHDSVTQTLWSASITADVLPRLWERDPEAVHEKLDELRRLTKGALAEMRALLMELRPSALMQLSVGELVRQLAEATASRAQLPVEVTLDGGCTLPADIQTALYRIAQEALNNVAHHSHASRAEVYLAMQSDRVEMRIADNGRGFAMESVPADHFGLRIMRERAETIQATLTVESQPEQGTRVSVLWEARGK